MSSWLTHDQREKGLTAEYLYHAATANWERKRPAWVMMMLSTLTRHDVASRGAPVLDMRLQHLAAGAGKRVGAIETPDEQCEPFNALGHDRVVFALNRTLSYFESRRLGLEDEDGGEWFVDTETLIERYRRGDLQSMRINQNLPDFESGRVLTKHERQMSQEVDSYFQAHLVEARNRRMAARVVNLLVNRPGKPYFFAFGAGHFVGPDNIVDLLGSAGFTVEPVSSIEGLQLR